MSTLRTARALAGREFIRFIRQPQRVIGAVGQPLLFWIFLGSGFSGSFRPPGMENVSYLEFFYPGVMLMMLLFASIFSSITVIEDRDQGFLQGVLVAPVSRIGIVLGKVVGATMIAMVQCLIFLLVAPFIGLTFGIWELALIVGALLVSSLGFSSLGFMLAWGMKSTAGFHAIMMIFLMPLWLLSGALFPMQHVPGPLYWLMLINPVAHALTVIRAPFGMEGAVPLFSGDYWISAAVVAVWVAACLWLSMLRVNKREKGAPALAAAE